MDHAEQKKLGLVLTRKLWEQVTLTTEQGDEILITVVRLSNLNTRLAIKAPRTVKISRQDVEVPQNASDEKSE